MIPSRIVEPVAEWSGRTNLVEMDRPGLYAGSKSTVTLGVTRGKLLKNKRKHAVDENRCLDTGLALTPR